MGTREYRMLMTMSVMMTIIVAMILMTIIPKKCFFIINKATVTKILDNGE